MTNITEFKHQKSYQTHHFLMAPFLGEAHKGAVTSLKVLSRSLGAALRPTTALTRPPRTLTRPLKTYSLVEWPGSTLGISGKRWEPPGTSYGSCQCLGPTCLLGVSWEPPGNSWESLRAPWGQVAPWEPLGVLMVPVKALSVPTFY